MGLVTILDTIGVFVFAMSGLATAAEKRMDLFGGLIIAFVTALGGGTLRDLLLDTEITWIHHTTPIYTVMAGAAFALLFKPLIKRIRKTIFLFDTLGIALFTIIGVQKALAFDTPVPVALIFGVITATFGGVIRDILCNEIPLIFRKEIYATACVIGAILYITLHKMGVPEMINLPVSGALIVGIRIIAVVKNLSLPIINDRI